MTQYKNIPDLELVAMYKKTGNSALVGELFTRYTHFVFSVSMKYLKNEDNSQEAVMQIFEKLLPDIKSMPLSNQNDFLKDITKNRRESTNKLMMF